VVNSINDCRSYFQLLSRCAQFLPFQDIERVAEILLHAYEEQRTVFTFGNGGSAALASHFACDLAKGTVNGSQKRFRAMALTDNVALMTAWANDSSYENIFAEQFANFAVPGDIAFAISASGNSANVLNALRVAKQVGATTVGITGFAGGKMFDLCDACIVVPCDNMQIIEDLHLCVAHSLFTCVRASLSQDSSPSANAGPRLVTRTGTR
jgi:D-sedoheptulose 7-phosphate isomerase